MTRTFLGEAIGLLLAGAMPANSPLPPFPPLELHSEALRSNWNERRIPFEQHFAPDENLEPIDVDLIDDAGASIDMAAYVLTDSAIQNSLVLAAQRGVKVRIFFDRSESFHTPPRFLNNLLAAGGQVKLSAPGPLMHLKTYCVDGTTLRFGAANFSYSGLTEQANDLEITRGPHACDGFERVFGEMWR